MISEAFIRRVALALPGAYEHASHDGQPSWRTKPRMFAWIRRDLDALVVWVDSLDAKEALIATRPKLCFTTPHYDGYAIVLVRMKAASQPLARVLIEESWKVRAPASTRRSGAAQLAERLPRPPLSLLKAHRAARAPSKTRRARST